MPLTRKHWPWIFGAAVFLLMIWAVGSSQTFQTCIGSNQFSVVPYKDCLGSFLSTQHASVTAAATLVIAILTLVIAGVSDKQAGLTKEAFIAEKRAFVFATDVSWYWDDPDPVTGFYSFRFRPNWRNSGDTPTKQMTMYCECELRNTELPKKHVFVEHRQDIVRTFVGPKAEIVGPLVPLVGQSGIAVGDVNDVQLGKKFLYLWGWGKYHDVFDGTRQHITRFCWLLDPVGDPFAFDPHAVGAPPVPGTLQFRVLHHSEGNCADDECD